jgi:hypothetical protein
MGCPTLLLFAAVCLATISPILGRSTHHPLTPAPTYQPHVIEYKVIATVQLALTLGGGTYLMYALSTYGAIYCNYKNYFWTFLPFTFYKVTVLNHRFRSNLHLLRGLNPGKSSSVGRKKFLKLSCTFSVGQ